jgi:hypothetical protein
VSAWAELIGYAGSVALNGLRILTSLEREIALTQELMRRKKARGAQSVVLSLDAGPKHRFFSISLRARLFFADIEPGDCAQLP